MTSFVLTAKHVEQIITRIGLDTLMTDLISRMQTAFKDFDPSIIDIPIRSGFNYTQPTIGLVEWMPLHQKGQDITIKVVGYHPDNPNNNNLPTILSTISTYCTKTGHLKSIIDGVLPTALRTGAASAVASIALAKPDSHKLGLIGSGAQSVTQLHALSRVFDINEVRIYDIDQSSIDSFEERCSAFVHGANILPATIGEIMNQSDIVCTATSVDVGAGPLFDDLISLPHCHVNAVGADFPGKVELSKSFLQSSFVCPDFKAQAMLEGECEQLNDDDIGPELEYIVKHPKQFEQYKNERTVFDSTGYPLEDKIISELLVNYAVELNIGDYIELENKLLDVKNPYGFAHAGRANKQLINSIRSDQKVLLT